MKLFPNSPLILYCLHISIAQSKETNTNHRICLIIQTLKFVTHLVIRDKYPILCTFFNLPLQFVFFVVSSYEGGNSPAEGSGGGGTNPICGLLGS